MDADSAASESTGRRVSGRAQTASDHPDICARGHRRPVPPGQRSRRRPVERPARQECSQRGRTLVGDRARRVVAHVPAGLVEPPDQVDVLTAAQRRSNRSGPVPRRSGRRGPRSGRTVCGPGTHGAFLVTPVERPAGDSKRRGLPGGDNPRRHRRHHRVVEMAEQRTRATLPRACSRSPRTRRACCAPRPTRRSAAPAGPTLTGRPTKAAPCRSATSLVAPASTDASSTTMQARPPATAHASKRSSCCGRSRTGTTTVTSSVPGCRVAAWGEGAAGHQPARQHLRRPPRPHVSAVSPASPRCPSPLRQSGTGAAGCPPSSTVPPSNSRVDASSVRVKEPGSGVVRARGAGRSGEGIPGALSWATAQSWQSGAGDRLGRCPEEVGMLAEDQDTQDVEELSDEDVDELLVEEVSIDGMCGVY